jgi:adenylylsulfate kinase
VHAHATIDALAARDVKGLYKKALAGEIKNFTGVSDPYEEPLKPELTLNSDIEKVEESLDRLLAALEAQKFIYPSGGAR